MAVTYSPDGHIANINANSVPDAKLTLKEIKLKKKEYANEKRDIAQRIAAIRADLRSRNVGRAAPVRLPGNIGKISRALNNVSKTSDRAATDSRVVALESTKRVLDGHIAKIDGAILQLDRWLLDHS